MEKSREKIRKYLFLRITLMRINNNNNNKNTEYLLYTKSCVRYSHTFYRGRRYIKGQVLELDCLGWNLNPSAHLLLPYLSHKVAVGDKTN